MFRTEGTPAYLRRKTAGEALALRAGRQTARSNVQLARVQGQQLSQTESRVAEKISGCYVVVRKPATPARPEVRSDERLEATLPFRQGTESQYKADTVSTASNNSPLTPASL